MNIKLINNLKYRPDLMGIERFWAAAKRIYKQQVNQFKTSSHAWYNDAWVAEVLDNLVSNQIAQQCAAHGLKSIANA